jgi:hypothetical protein
LTNTNLVNEGAFFARFQAAVMASFKKIDNGKAHVVARAVVLASWIAETDDENVSRRAASGAIAAPAAKSHLLGVALGGTLGGSLGRCAFASFTLGRAVFH